MVAGEKKWTDRPTYSVHIPELPPAWLKTKAIWREEEHLPAIKEVPEH